MSKAINKSLSESLSTIRAAADTSVFWGWDNRYRTVLLATKPESAESIKFKFNNCFSHSWTSDNHKDGGQSIQGLVNFLAGLHNGQTLYTKDLGGGLLAFAAFWPWAGQPSVSLRIGVYRTNKNATVSISELVEQLKTVFEVES